MRIVITDEAALDLERIADNIAKDNPERAVTFVRELRANCDGLGEFPERYPLVPRYEERRIRRRVHGNYLIFYRIDADSIVVLHVLHGAMDYTSLLFPEN